MTNEARHEPRTPQFEEVVRASFARQGLMTHLGAQLDRVAPGEVEISAPFRPEITQQQGAFHGGVVASLLDSACGYAALTLMPTDSEVVSVEFKVNLLAPGAGDRLVARGRVVRSGRTITVCRGDAYGVTGDGERHCATMTATMMRVAPVA